MVVISTATPAGNSIRKETAHPAEAGKAGRLTVQKTESPARKVSGESMPHSLATGGEKNKARNFARLARPGGSDRQRGDEYVHLAVGVVGEAA